MIKFIHEKGVCWIDSTKITGITYCKTSDEYIWDKVTNSPINIPNSNLKLIEVWLPYGTIVMSYKSEVDRENARMRLMVEDK